MSLSKGSINALNVLDARRLEFIPAHFAKMTINTTPTMIDKWVYNNLNSRYAIVKNLRIDSNNKLVEVHELGVEDPKELTILSLSCPHLDNNHRRI